MFLLYWKYKGFKTNKATWWLTKENAIGDYRPTFCLQIIVCFVGQEKTSVSKTTYIAIRSQIFCKICSTWAAHFDFFVSCQKIIKTWIKSDIFSGPKMQWERRFCMACCFLVNQIRKDKERERGGGRKKDTALCYFAECFRDKLFAVFVKILIIPDDVHLPVLKWSIKCVMKACTIGAVRSARRFPFYDWLLCRNYCGMLIKLA